MAKNVYHAAMAELSGPGNTLVINKTILRIVGNDHAAALMLGQLLFWYDKGARSDGFVWKTYKEWYDETCLTRFQVSRAAAKLQEMNIIECKTFRLNNSPHRHFKINIEVVAALLADQREKQSEQNV